VRDLIVVLVFCGVALMALRRPYIGVLLWTWISVMNPHRLCYGFAQNLPLAFAAAGVTFTSLLINRSQLKMRWDGAVYALIAFALWTGITTIFAFSTERSFDLMVERILKVQTMTLVCLATIRDRKQIEQLIWVIVISLGFYGIKGGIFGILTGGSARVWGPSGALIEGNNEIGLALVMTIPLMNYLRSVAPRVWMRQGLIVAMGLSSVAALATQSRGAFLAIAAMGTLLWLRSRKKLVGGIVIVSIGVSLVGFMPASWETRMQTINTYDQDASAMGRINAWTNAFNIANDRVTGAGFDVARGDIFAKYAPIPNVVLTAHSIYFQALGEHGWIGLTLFLLIGALTFRNAAQVRSQARGRPELLWLFDLAGMIQVSMVGYAVGGAFLSLTYFDVPYYIMAIVVALKCGLLEGMWQKGSVGAFGSGVRPQPEVHEALAGPGMPRP
jgi:probable O-glycosylation ligase (exosortase A-associated)